MKEVFQLADGKIVIDVLLEDGQVAKGVADLKGKLGGVSESGEKASLSLGKIVTALGLVALGTKAIGMMKDSLDAAFKRIDTMEQFERTMTAITGSSEEAQAALDRTNEAVTGTAYGLDVAASAVQNFVTRGADINDATNYVEKWGDAVAFYGDGSNEQFSNVSDALANMLTTGKVSMDQINRLYAAGIPAPEMYAEATGMSMEEVMKGFQSGEISAEDFVNTVTDVLHTGTESFVSVEGAAKEAGNSWGNVFTNMQAAVTRGVISIIQSIDQMLEDNGLPNMREMVAEFGRRFEEAINMAADAIPKLVEWIKTAYDIMKPWLPLLGSILAGVTSVVLALATYTTVVGAINAVKKAFLLLNKTIYMNPIALIAMAIVAAAILIYVYWEPISEFFKNLWDKVKQYSLVVWEVLKAAWAATVNYFKDLWEDIKIASMLVWEALKSVWQSTVSFFVSLWSGISGFFIGLWNTMIDFAVSVWDSVVSAWQWTVNLFKTVWGSVSDFFITLWTGIVEFFTNVWNKVVEVVMMVVEPIVAVIMDLYNRVVEIVTPWIEFFRDIWTQVLESAMTIWNSLKEFLSTLWTTIVTIATEVWTILKNVVLGLVLLLIDLVTFDFQAFASHLSQIWENIKESAMNIWNAIKDTVIAFSDLVTTYVSEIWNIAKAYVIGVWTTLQETAITIWGYIKEFIQFTVDTIKAVIEFVWTAIKNFFTVTLVEMWNTTKERFTAIYNTIKSWIDSAKATIENVWNAIKNFFVTTLRDMWNTTKERFTAIYNTIKSWIDSAKATIESVWNAIKRFFTVTLRDLWNEVKQKFRDMYNSVRDWMNDTKDKIVEIWDTVMDFFNGIDLYQIGSDIIGGLIEGIKSMAESVWTAVTDITDGIKKAITGALEIFSPSRWMRDEVAGMLFEGFDIGVDRKKGSTIKKAQQAAEWMKPDVSTVDVDFIGMARGIGETVAFDRSGSLNQSTSHNTNNNTKTYAPTINNHFTPAESTPAESARRQRREQKRLAQEMGY